MIAWFLSKIPFSSKTCSRNFLARLRLHWTKFRPKHTLQQRWNNRCSKEKQDRKFLVLQHIYQTKNNYPETVTRDTKSWRYWRYITVFFLAGANFWAILAILGQFGQIWVIFGVLYPKICTGQEKLAPTGRHGRHDFATLYLHRYGLFHGSMDQ